MSAYLSLGPEGSPLSPSLTYSPSLLRTIFSPNQNIFGSVLVVPTACTRRSKNVGGGMRRRDDSHLPRVHRSPGVQFTKRLISGEEAVPPLYDLHCIMSSVPNFEGLPYGMLVYGTIEHRQPISKSFLAKCNVLAVLQQLLLFTVGVAYDFEQGSFFHACSLIPSSHG